MIIFAAASRRSRPFGVSRLSVASGIRSLRLAAMSSPNLVHIRSRTSLTSLQRLLSSAGRYLLSSSTAHSPSTSIAPVDAGGKVVSAPLTLTESWSLRLVLGALIACSLALILTDLRTRGAIYSEHHDGKFDFSRGDRVDMTPMEQALLDDLGPAPDPSEPLAPDRGPMSPYAPGEDEIGDYGGHSYNISAATVADSAAELARVATECAEGFHIGRFMTRMRERRTDSGDLQWTVDDLDEFIRVVDTDLELARLCRESFDSVVQDDRGD